VAGVSRFFIDLRQREHTRNINGPLRFATDGDRRLDRRSFGRETTMIGVLWKSPGCIAAMKPAGLATQAPPAFPSLHGLLREQLSLPYIAFPHRLDRPVSGVILVALNKRTANLLGQQFESRKVIKRYLAWVAGDATVCPAHWEDFIRKLPDEPRCEITIQTHPDAKLAVTRVRVIRSDRSRTLLELSPETGRMHQLRVQCAHRGHPIIGDAMYGSTIIWREATATRLENSAAAADSNPVAAIALHAWQIEFHEPNHGKRIRVEAPPPWDDSHLPM